MNLRSATGPVRDALGGGAREVEQATGRIALG